MSEKSLLEAQKGQLEAQLGALTAGQKVMSDKCEKLAADLATANRQNKQCRDKLEALRRVSGTGSSSSSSRSGGGHYGGKVLLTGGAGLGVAWSGGAGSYGAPFASGSAPPGQVPPGRLPLGAVDGSGGQGPPPSRPPLGPLGGPLTSGSANRAQSGQQGPQPLGPLRGPLTGGATSAAGVTLPLPQYNPYLHGSWPADGEDYYDPKDDVDDGHYDEY
ncbi:hypothetical protein HYH03_014767 [Edaphochlamys debaryana]|uniref:Uncharacterized protein n=1 Tax=Edaphochlamys debaryana TaxID=47281 RepID=A0A835XN59_9CHLO|nr:hypothetical protein HYH03_014767 [Edaphochlamys debaryana]|eukprot:KAG2486599.1 hypothetical protein HYH03_014767 [Edaphochlamys debaryana]